MAKIHKGTSEECILLQVVVSHQVDQVSLLLETYGIQKIVPLFELCHRFKRTLQVILILKITKEMKVNNKLAQLAHKN